MKLRVIGAINELAEEEQEAVGRTIVPCSICVCTIEEHVTDPSQALLKLVTAPMLVE